MTIYTEQQEIMLRKSRQSILHRDADRSKEKKLQKEY